MSKKIAVLITDDFEDSEFTSPAEAFKLAGHQVITIEKQAGKTVKGKQGEAEVAIDRAIDDVTPGEFDALLLPGGYSPDQLRGDERFVTFTRDFVNGSAGLQSRSATPARRRHHAASVIFSRNPACCR